MSFELPSKFFEIELCSRLQCVSAPSRYDGGRGRIRTSVARKERQIYSLLVLATHPPVPQEHRDLRRWSRPGNFATQKGLVSKDTSPSVFQCEEFTGAKPKIPILKKFSWRRELNPRPSDYKSDALPAELRQHDQTLQTYHAGNQIARGCDQPARLVPSWL